MSTPQEKVMLPMHCARHIHVGFGSSKECPCPWCEIERLRKGIQDALDNIYSHDVFMELAKMLEPPSDNST